MPSFNRNAPGTQFAASESLPRRNRVTPFGEIVAIRERGTIMGNRGVIHNAAGQIVREWKLNRWIICLLEFKGRRRRVMTPGRWTELYFLDEATALAAGHRPCAECRRERFDAFRTAWAAANREKPPTAPEIDEQLHHERVADDYSKKTYIEDLGKLPDGVAVTLDDPAQAYLFWCRRLLRWTARGYQPAPPSRRKNVRVLTPRSTVRAMQAGYVPAVHPSAEN